MPLVLSRKFSPIPPDILSRQRVSSITPFPFILQGEIVSVTAFAGLQKNVKNGLSNPWARPNQMVIVSPGLRRGGAGELNDE